MGVEPGALPLHPAEGAPPPQTPPISLVGPTPGWFTQGSRARGSAPAPRWRGLCPLQTSPARGACRPPSNPPCIFNATAKRMGRPAPCNPLARGLCPLDPRIRHLGRFAACGRKMGVTSVIWGPNYGRNAHFGWPPRRPAPPAANQVPFLFEYCWSVSAR